LQVFDRDYDIDDDTLGSASKNTVDGLTPSKMVVGAEGKKNGSEFFIFADDGTDADDDLSMVSDAAKAPSIPPPTSDDKKRVQNKYPQLTEDKREREQRLEQAAMKVVGVVPKEKGAKPVAVPASSKVYTPIVSAGAKACSALGRPAGDDVMHRNSVTTRQ
jgi:hypothetical protein